MSVFEEIDEGDIIGPSLLGDIINDSIESGVDNFSLEGSLQDYMVDDYVKICRAEISDGKLACDLQLDWPDDFDEDKKGQEKRRLKDTFIRVGAAKHSNLSNIMKKLRDHDDVIVGLDTNVLVDCVISSVLVDELYAEEFPNWILFVIPKITMAEIENKANQKFSGPPDNPRLGWPQYAGRIGQRALQEILELDKEDPNYPGLSIMTIGNLDNPETVKTSDNWWKDSEIRNQFQDFLRRINFHKGTYFLSQDRVNVMMSGAEGAEGLYLQKPDFEDFESGKISVEKCKEILYELCIQFGKIKVEGTEGSELNLQLSIFWPGKHVSDWRKSKLKVNRLENEG